MTYQELIATHVPKGAKPTMHGTSVSFEVAASELRDYVSALTLHDGIRLVSMVATDERATEKDFKIFYVFAVPASARFLVPFIRVGRDETYPSIANEVHAASMYERTIKESFGLSAEGHPGVLEPHRLHAPWPTGTYPMRADFDPSDANKGEPVDGKSISYTFGKIEGEGIYEVPVGPVHAGIIEPGHFRFSMAGEEIISLEARLGWVHKGSEKLFESLAIADQLRLSERIAGDTSFTHALAYAQAIEDLASLSVPERAQHLRVLYSEIERLANHVSDIGFIMGDTGFNFGGAHCSRLRERVMQLAERATGSRFLRGANAIGGVHADLDQAAIEEMSRTIADIARDFEEVMHIADESTSLYNRLVGTGIVAREAALDHAAVGVAGRASGIQTDARKDFPYAAYTKFPISLPGTHTGDVFARYMVRVHEARESLRIMTQVLSSLPKGSIKGATELGALALRKHSFAVGVAEGWRGEIAYFIATDADGKVRRVAPRDPSFINWHLAPIAAGGNVLLDFPLINKSFNMSYSGNDL